VRTFNKVLDHLEEWLVASFMGLATVVIFVSVLHRYTGDVPWIWKYTQHLSLTWAQELCIYLFIWMAKFGAAYGVRTGIHVGVDVLVRLLEPAKRRFWITFDLLAGAFFTGVIAVLGAMFVWRMMGTGQVSPDLELPMWIVYLAVPLGSALMCYRFLQVCWRYRRSGELPSHNVAHVDGIEAQART
jgi:C4-dicarboxylate transporter, DctQ subunit